VKNKQQYVLNLLSALKIPYKTRDISQCEEDKQFMMKVLRELGKPVIAPQLFLDNEYIGLEGFFYEDLAGHLFD
ncbi:SH3-binding, glutamic acid-rich protein, partial [Opisthorchis viverrini]